MYSLLRFAQEIVVIGFNTASVSPRPILAAALSDYNLPPLFESQGQERFESSRVHYQTRKISVSDTVHSRCFDLTSMKVCLDTGKMLTIPESPCLGGLFHLSGPKARSKDHHEQVRRHLCSFKPRCACSVSGSCVPLSIVWFLGFSQSLS